MNSMRRSAINRRMNRGEVLSRSAEASTVRSKVADWSTRLVMRPARLPEDRPRRLCAGGGLPLDAVGDDVQQPLPVGHVVRVAGLDRLPGVPARVGCRKPERAGT